MSTTTEQETKTEKPVYVYKIMPFAYFLQTTDLRCWYLPRVSVWDDPYELFLLKQKFIDTNGSSRDLMYLANNYYGTCWSASRDSDALWRIYSPDKMSVRIKTSWNQIQMLCNSLNGQNGLYYTCRPVTYHSAQQMNQWLSSLQQPFSPNNNVLLDSLFMKRNAFSHENEYRIIAYKMVANDALQPSFLPSHVDMPFSMKDFIEEVSLDPRLSSEEVDFMKGALSLRIGNGIRVSQSTLYKIKPRQITLF